MQKRTDRLFNRIYIIAVAAAVIGILIGGAFMSPVYVIGQSMEPALRSGDLVRTRRKFDKADLQKGMVVVAEPTQFENRVIKRIAALGGDVVDVEEDRIIVNDQLFSTYKPNTSYKTGEYTVPEGSCFLLGDNLNNSLDSRTFGIVSCDDITRIVTTKIIHL